MRLTLRLHPNHWDTATEAAAAFERLAFKRLAFTTSEYFVGHIRNSCCHFEVGV
jgi:hypothetical protein